MIICFGQIFKKNGTDITFFGVKISLNSFILQSESEKKSEILDFFSWYGK